VLCKLVTVALLCLCTLLANAPASAAPRAPRTLLIDACGQMRDNEDPKRWALSVAQRRLSSPARELRRRTNSLEGVRVGVDGRAEELSLSGLLAPLDGALAALSLGVVVTACALVAARLY